MSSYERESVDNVAPAAFTAVTPACMTTVLMSGTLYLVAKRRPGAFSKASWTFETIEPSNGDSPRTSQASSVVRKLSPAELSVAV